MMKAGRLLPLILCAAVLFTACGGKKTETTDSTASGAAENISEGTGTADPYMDVTGKKVGIALPSASDERWSADGAYLEQYLKEKGCEVSLVYSDGLGEQQTADVSQLLSDGCDLLIVSPLADASLAEVLGKAAAADIPVISYDRMIRGTDAVSYYISYDHYRIGQQQGQYCIDALGLKPEDTSKEYNMEFFAGDPADTDTGYLFNGAYDTLKPYLDAGVLNVPSGQMTFGAVTSSGADSSSAENRMKELLNTRYDKKTQLDILLCADDTAALGVIKALDSSYKGKNHVIVTGQGCGQENLNCIRSGKQSMTVYMAPGQEAAVAADLAFTLLAGESADGSLISDSAWDFTCVYDTSSYDNGTGIIPSYLIVPEVITADNIRTVIG